MNKLHYTPIADGNGIAMCHGAKVRGVDLTDQKKDVTCKTCLKTLKAQVAITAAEGRG